MRPFAVIAPLVAAALLPSPSAAFAPALPRTSALPAAGSVVHQPVVHQPVDYRPVMQLRASEGDEPAGLPPLPSQKNAPAKEAPAPVPVAAPVDPAPVAASTAIEEVEGEDTSSYPIGLPSPLLLGTSMVLAIASTGSLFEITGGGPTTLGFGPTAALAAIGLPLSLFLIYAAILKGAAETEEDDREYNKPRRL